MQLDIIHHSPASLARAYRIAADTERHNPYFTPGERERRAAAHTAEAERLERIAEQDRAHTMRYQNERRTSEQSG